jgi:hypothetical protein
VEEFRFDPLPEEAALIPTLEQGCLVGEVRSIEDIRKEVFAGHFCHSKDSTPPWAEPLHFGEDRGYGGCRQRCRKERILIFSGAPLMTITNYITSAIRNATLFFIVWKRSSKGLRPTVPGPE